MTTRKTSTIELKGKIKTETEKHEFCQRWDAADHLGKVGLCAEYDVSYATGRHWRSDWGIPRTATRVYAPVLEDSEDADVLGDLDVDPSINLDFVVFDIETTNLTADFSVVLCACIKPFGQEPIVFRCDNYPAWNRGLRADDSMIVMDIAAELAKHAVVVTHYGCLTVGHRVLRSDLTWIPVEKLNIGDKLLAFDDNAQEKFGRRHWKDSVVEQTGIKKMLVQDITLSDGTTLRATCNHPWLVPRIDSSGIVGYGWKETRNLKVGDKMSRMLEPWSGEDSYERGYLGGFFDGEGTISQIETKNRWGKHNFILAASQLDNLALAKASRCLDNIHIPYSVRVYDRTQPNMRCIAIQGGTENILRFLGMCQPVRLMGKLKIENLGSVKNYNRTTISVVGISLPYEDDVVTLGTSTGTYIAEGFGCHNSKFDIPYLRAKMVKYGITPLPPMFGVDTFAIAKMNFKVSSRRLENLSKYFELGFKSGVEGNLWVRAAMDGNKECIDAIVAHNIQDCVLLEKLAALTYPYMRAMKKL